MTRTVTEALAGLRVRRRGVPTAGRPVVVLVHGAMDRGASFGRVARRLDDFCVVAPDRRGYDGSSGAGPPVGLDGHLEDLCRVLDGLDGPSVVVGHSLGGTLALAVATLGRADVVSVGAFEAPVPWVDGTASRVGGSALAVAAAEGPGAAAEHFYRSAVGDEVWARIGTTERAARRAEGPALVAELTDLRSGRAVFDVDRLRGGVHLAHGTVAPTVLADGMAALSGRSSGTLTVLEGAPHGAHLSHPDAYAGWIAGQVLAVTGPHGAVVGGPS